MSALGWTAGACAAAAAASAVVAWRLRPEVDLTVELGAQPRSRRPFGRVRRSLARVGGVPIVGRLAPRDVEERLEAAGWEAAPEEVVGAGVVGAALAGLVLVGGPPPLPLLAPAGVVIGIRLPTLVLARAVTRRRARAYRELPAVLDMLSAAASAGVPGPLALRRASAVTDGPLAEELRRAFVRVDLGARWKEQVDVVADRLELIDLRRLSATLGRGESLGSAVTDAVTSLADDVREERRAVAADRARRAPVKMLFPLVFLVLPAFLLLTVVPVLVTTLGSIR